MIDISQLTHPFQNDPGVSQRQRVMNELLSGAPSIDGRTLADLLDQFRRLAPEVNYYDENLQVSDWTPFFKDSLPFLLASIVKESMDVVEAKFRTYDHLARKNPSGAGLQLSLFYVYHHTFRKINTWHTKLKGSGLPAEQFIARLIRNRLRSSFLAFVPLANAVARYYCVKEIDFSEILLNDAWAVQQKDLFAVDTDFLQRNSERDQLLALQHMLAGIFPGVLGGLRTVPLAAEKDLPASLTPPDGDLQKKHTPHLALIFVFLRMYQLLQKDLNGFTRKHLDFFYQQVLQLRPQDAVPDKANIVFQLQNLVEPFLLKKGVLVKDGKDNNKAEMLFSLDDDIVVNRTEVSDVRTLFVNNQTVQDHTYIEGVYMAPNATLADGISKEFKDDPKNFPTLGARESKYIAPGADHYQPYPDARLGAVFASPVLLLNEGMRKVTFTLSCKIRNNCDATQLPGFVDAGTLYGAVRDTLSKTFIYITEDLLQTALQKGIPKDITDAVRKKYLLDDCRTPVFSKDQVFYKERAMVPMTDDFWSAVTPDAGMQKILSATFPARKGFKVLFSGEKDWIAPDFAKTRDDLTIELTPPPLVDGVFTITIIAIIRPEQPAVTFYDAKNLQEELGTILPLAKLQLEDDIKLPLDSVLQGAPGLCGKEVSLYSFFRNVIIEDKDTEIKVQVSGLRRLIVQNDESVQDVNSPIYPFGTMPRLNANFFIGSEEVFYKRWSDVWVNTYWKDLPHEGFSNYYNGYQYEYRDANGVIIKKVDEIRDANFLMQASFLQDGQWFTRAGTSLCDIDNANYEPLFPAGAAPDTHQYHFAHNDFTAALPAEKLSYTGIKRMDAGARQFFLRWSLKCQDFQHSKYPVILGRQLTAAAKLPDLTDSAVYYNINSAGEAQKVDIKALLKDIVDAEGHSEEVKPKLEELLNKIISLMNKGNKFTVDNTVWQAIFSQDSPGPHRGANTINDSDLYTKFMALYTMLLNDKNKIENFEARGAVIPNEPWTPIMSSISLDYIATAAAADIDLIHLYPYDGTYRREEMRLQPPMFPVFCDEGNLFLGLKGLVPGENLNILFQLAEATSDSESPPRDVSWYYLANNTWQSLRTKFEVLEDGTFNLTTSGIIKFALPANMTTDNTIMPGGLYWIKAGIPGNSGAVSETIAILPQAISVTFTNDPANDKLRLGDPLPPGSISKLQTADAHIKSVSQPYEGFGGDVPELQSQYYVRVSELLRHKGRAIQKFDYERLVLQAFPQIYKAKCINHSFALNAHAFVNDFPFAPGYVLLAVIPDLNKLKAGNSFQPKTPVSILEKIEKYIQGRTSPFVRIRAMNPRYEAVHFSITVQLLPGKDREYYKAQLAGDIRRFMAPWVVGDYYKLTFGQCVSRSDIIQFLETRDYVDFIVKLKMLREDDTGNPCDEPMQICPATPRSILIAGDVEASILS